VTLSERIFSNLNVLNVLLLGASRTNDLVMQHLSQKGVAKLTVANRTLENAEQLAKQHNASSVLLSEVPSELESADIVVTSTNSQLPLIGKGIVESALRVRKHRPILFLDLAVPRDVEEEVGEIADAYLYTIDDISSVVTDGVRSRVDAAIEAQEIIEKGVDNHFRALRSLNAVETLRAYRTKASTIQERELEKALKALEKGELAEVVVANLARSITNKLTHEPSVQLKKFSEEGRQEAFELTSELLGLNQK
jgi:glutamyl-tRNA reductase